MADKRNGMRDRILDASERRVRKTGFVDLSFRDIAVDVGIKSASVHYHFPTKSNLGEALIEQYSERFKTALDEIDTSDLRSAIESFIALYDTAFVIDEKICLCAILGAEAMGLPDEINHHTKAFFEFNLVWLKSLFMTHFNQEKAELATLIVTSLEGAILVASVCRNRSVLEVVSAELLAQIDRQ